MLVKQQLTVVFVLPMFRMEATSHCDVLQLGSRGVRSDRIDRVGGGNALNIQLSVTSTVKFDWLYGEVGWVEVTL